MPDKLLSDEEEMAGKQGQQEQLQMTTGKKSLQWYKQKLQLTLK